MAYLGLHIPQDRGGRTLTAGKRLGITYAEFIEGWFVSYSPGNSNNNAEGPWYEWVDLAQQILGLEWQRAQLGVFLEALGIVYVESEEDTG